GGPGRGRGRPARFLDRRPEPRVVDLVEARLRAGRPLPAAARARLPRAGGRARLARARRVRISPRPPPLRVRQPRGRPWLSCWWLASAQKVLLLSRWRGSPLATAERAGGLVDACPTGACTR